MQVVVPRFRQVWIKVGNQRRVTEIHEQTSIAWRNFGDHLPLLLEQDRARFALSLTVFVGALYHRSRNSVPLEIPLE